jgi:hypothetical protein
MDYYATEPKNLTTKCGSAPAENFICLIFLNKMVMM